MKYMWRTNPWGSYFSPRAAFSKGGSFPMTICINSLETIVFTQTKQKILSESIRNVFELLDKESKRKMALLTPEMAKKIIGF